MTNLFLQKKSIKLDYHTEPKKKAKKRGGREAPIIWLIVPQFKSTNCQIMS